MRKGGGRGGWGPHVGCRLKFITLSVVGSNFGPLSVVGKSQLIFLSLVGKFSSFCR